MKKGELARHVFANDMKVLLVGINPHFGSDRRGIPFSNNKMFWYLLNKSDAIDENRDHLKDDGKLRQIYLRKFAFG